MAYESTVLIVDDEPSARDTLEALLFREGYNLVFATDGPKALDLAAKLVPDLILLDVMMPGMDGFDVCQRLRGDPLLAEVPVIMITALDDRDSRLRGIQAGADDFVSKPFDRIELRARVQTITQLNRYRRLLLERAKFEWVVEQADDGYLIVLGDEITYANSQARLYLGLPPSGSGEAPEDERDTIAGAFLELARRQYHCEPEEAWATWPEQAAPGSQLPRYLVRPESPTAGTFWLRVDAMEMAALAGYLVRLRDVTGSVLNQANVWTFQALVSHKLRTPLTIVTGYMAILADDLPASLDAGMATCFKTAHDSVKRLQDEVLDILRYIDAPETLASGPGWCDLGEIPDIVTEINASLGIESLDVSSKGQDLGDACVPISRRAMELMLWEILENAKKFHPVGSPAVEIRISDTPDGVRLQVSDDGLTLSPDQLARMWVPYYQAERGFSGQVPGIGLGLSMVATLVWRVGGTCHAYGREQGPGVVVEIVLPAGGGKEPPNPSG